MGRYRQWLTALTADFSKTPTGCAFSTVTLVTLPSASTVNSRSTKPLRSCSRAFSGNSGSGEYNRCRTMAATELRSRASLAGGVELGGPAGAGELPALTPTAFVPPAATTGNSGNVSESPAAAEADAGAAEEGRAA